MIPYLVILNSIILFSPRTFCEEVLRNNVHNENTDKHTANADTRSFRRFHEDMSDKEWHVSHLKDTDFALRSECPGDTLDDKIYKYRRALKSDAALVEYVFAAPLPSNEKDILNADKCTAPNITDLFAGKANNKNEETAHEVNSATTVKGKPIKVKVDNMTAQAKGRRAGDYQFSSVEYYDDVTEFDATLCPDTIEVITLEQDQLRSYDVECEMIIEWMSLDD